MHDHKIQDRAMRHKLHSAKEEEEEVEMCLAFEKTNENLPVELRSRPAKAKISKARSLKH